MFTKWNQVEDWIRDNSLKRWSFYANNPDKRADGERANDRILDSKLFGGDIENKIELTKKYIESAGRKVWGLGFQGDTATTGGLICEVQIEANSPYSMLPQMQPVQGIGGGIGEVERKEMEDRIRKQIMNDVRESDLTKREKELRDQEREFRKDKESALGIMVGYLKPLLDAKISGMIPARAAVAGVDAQGDVPAARIVPTEDPDAPQVEDQDDAPFTDDEADELFALLAEFKQLEPEYYLTMLRNVVNMAKANDTAYQMARNFLIK